MKWFKNKSTYVEVKLTGTFGESLGKYMAHNPSQHFKDGYMHGYGNSPENAIKDFQAKYQKFLAKSEDDERENKRLKSYSQFLSFDETPNCQCQCCK